MAASGYYPGQEIEVLYGSEWFRALVKRVTPAGICADWGDGTFAAGLGPHEVRAMSRNVSPSPPQFDTKRKVSPVRTSRAALSPAPPLNIRQMTPPPVTAVIAFYDSLFRLIGVRCGLPSPVVAIPECDIMWAFRHDPETARAVFRNPLRPLARDPNDEITSARFSQWASGCDADYIQWLEDELNRTERISIASPMPPQPVPVVYHSHISNSVDSAAVQEPYPSPAAIAAPPPEPEKDDHITVEQMDHQEQIGTVASTRGRSRSPRSPRVDARVNMTGSPHRTRKEAFEAAMSPRLREPSPPKDHGYSEPCTPECSHRPPSPESIRNTNSPTRSRGRSAGSRNASRKPPVSVVVSSVKNTGFKTNLNGKYTKVAPWPSDESAGVVLRYKKEGGGAVLYKTTDGRWRLNDSDSAIGWVYSNKCLQGKWIEDKHAGDFTGASGTPYPIVNLPEEGSRTRSAKRAMSPASRSAQVDSLFGRTRPGKGQMSSGAPRMAQTYRAATDVYYASPSSFRSGSEKMSKAAFTSSFGSTPRFHKTTSTNGRV
eukprot:TRINITY_DN27285_c0_g1_i1.p1 TRINITY_DN27285_c0_g1~~TRINITY_DN27285_c0_g1_i1.p1  ORF type:complete len:564 (+),score=66.12 TRINITY_DN27285_c0_g1_i1:65-1693(+)